MHLEISALSESQLAEYATVPISFVVTHRMTADAQEVDAPSRLRMTAIPEPFEKNYDAFPGMSPLDWPSRYRIHDWGILAARCDGVLIGGAAVAPAVEVGMKEEQRTDTAVLWDLRVAPAARGRQIGTALFHAAERWAVRAGYTFLLAETQDINVAACRFYQALGRTLISYVHNAYPDVPGEARLIWRRELVL
jgi:GNAT superfamily N-acetyltransferase